MSARVEQALLREIIEQAQSLTLSNLDFLDIVVSDHDRDVLKAGITQGADMALSVLSRRRLICGDDPNFEGLELDE